MLLCHALALHERGVGLHADVLPQEGDERKDVEVAAISPTSITIPSISDAPLLHRCQPGDELDGVDTRVGRLKLHLQGEDPVAALLDAGMQEEELNQLVIKAYTDTEEEAE